MWHLAPVPEVYVELAGAGAPASSKSAVGAFSAFPLGRALGPRPSPRPPRAHPAPAHTLPN
eukprot:2950403-Alexandrium_andersonii.AAC.1